jgi:hypothetical protein
MAYMNPQQYLKAITGIGRGSRYTAFEDPNEADPNEILKFTGPYQARGGTPNFSGSRAASGTYDPVPVQQASTGTGLTSLQKGLEQFNQQQGGFGGDRPQVAAAPGVSAGGMSPFMANINPGLRQLSEPTVADSMSQAGGGDDPQGMMSKVGGFFNRPGAARDLGAALTSLGAGMAAESSRPGGSALAGFASGAGLATQSLARSREEARLEEERAVEAAERAREAKVREDLQAALTKMAETGELTPDQIQIAQGIASFDPAAGLSVIAEFRAENTTTTFVDSFLTDLPPDVLEKLEESGQADFLRAPSSVFSNDQKLDVMMTHGSEITRQENAIDSLLWKLHNIDDRSLASPEQLEQAQFISRNAEYTELMLRSPLNWETMDLGDTVQYWRDDNLIRTMNKSVDDPVVTPAVLEGFEEFYNLEDTTRSQLYQYKRGLDAIERLPAEAFGQKTGALRRAWQVFQEHIRDGGERGAGLAVLEGSWAALGFANLSSFVGPTSDYEFGIAQDLNGTMDLTKEDLKKHMLQMYRIRLDRIAEHNDRLLRRVPDEEMRELFLIRLSPEDFYTPTRIYYDDLLGSRLSSPGHEEMLSGVRSWTGASQELGPDRVAKPAVVPTSVTPSATPDSLQATFDSLQATPKVVGEYDLSEPSGLLEVVDPEDLPQRTSTGKPIPPGSTWTYSGQEDKRGPFLGTKYKWELRDEFYKLIETAWRDSPQ